MFRVLFFLIIFKSVKFLGNINFFKLSVFFIYKFKSKNILLFIFYYFLFLGKFGRLEFYSLIERNNLNKVSVFFFSQFKILFQVGRRFNNGDQWNRDRFNFNKYRFSSYFSDVNKSFSERIKFLASEFEELSLSVSRGR